MNTRADLINAFVRDARWGDATLAPLAGDASNRRYLRLTRRNGALAVLMDAPPDKGEDTGPFVHIAKHLNQLGLSAPEIFAQDAENGFLLLEDLGDDLYARVLRRDPKIEPELYAAAVDALVALHKSPCPTALLPYDAETTAPLAALAYDWYQFGTDGACDPEAKARFVACFEPILKAFDDDLTVLIQRDYHAENLLWLPERGGVARVGLLDFQDAMRGHPVYDLVSLLQDARRDVSAQTVDTMKSRFMDMSGTSRSDFEAAYAVFGLQRNLRILGVFARLCLRDQKAHYVDFIPRVWGFIQTNLAHPALAQVAECVARDLPAPDTPALAQIREKCGICAGQ